LLYGWCNKLMVNFEIVRVHYRNIDHSTWRCIIISKNNSYKKCMALMSHKTRYVEESMILHYSFSSNLDSQHIWMNVLMI
jgi:hypothetical protein